MNQEILQTKSELVNEVVASIKDSSTVVICEYRGLTVAELTELRKTLRTTDSSMAVYKNTLVKRAVESLGLTDAVQYLEGPNAFIFCKDVTAGAKVLAKYSRKNDLLVIKAGIVEGKVVDKKKMIELSKLPNKEGMISMLLSVLQAPVRQLACAVKAVADSKN
jgi:large subunit ribosomal protein L10